MADTTSLKLPEELKDRLGKVAQRVEQTPHAYMVQAIAEKVERDEKRQAFREEGRKALEEYKRTGIASTKSVTASGSRPSATSAKPVSTNSCQYDPGAMSGQRMNGAGTIEIR